MTGREGGFFSAIDAETGGHEGAYYTWTVDELDAALSGPDGELFMNVYGIDGPPPFEGERYVLHLPVPLEEIARTGGIPEAELARRLDRGRRALLEARSRRERPLTDDKVLADWNGLMIAAMARAGARLAEPRYLDAARRAARLRAREPGRRRDAPALLARRPRFGARPSSTTTRSSSRACCSCTRRRARPAGSTRRCASPTSRRRGSPTRTAAASSPRARTRVFSSAPSPPSTAPSPPETASRR